MRTVISRVHNQGVFGYAEIIEKIEHSGLSLADTKDNELRRKLAAAGFTSPIAPRLYTLLRLVLVILLPATVLFFNWMSADPVPGSALML